MIPEGEFNASVQGLTYKDGVITTTYLVRVPDHTRSGDYRFEYVKVTQRAHDVRL